MFNGVMPVDIETLHITTIEFDASNNPIYIGIAVAGTLKSDHGWQIKRLTFDGSNNMTDVQFANGSIGFVAVWDDRASYLYS